MTNENAIGKNVYIVKICKITKSAAAALPRYGWACRRCRAWAAAVAACAIPPHGGGLGGELGALRRACGCEPDGPCGGRGGDRGPRARDRRRFSHGRAALGELGDDGSWRGFGLLPGIPGRVLMRMRGSFLGAICYWAQGRAPLISSATVSSSTSADLDALADQIYMGGPQGRALRAAARRLHSTDGDVWNWAARRARPRSQIPEAARREDHRR